MNHPSLPPVSSSAFAANSPLTVADVLAILRRRWLTGILTVCVVFGVGFAALLAIKPLYEATAELMIAAPSVNMVDHDAQANAQKVDVSDLSTQGDLLSSSPVLKRVLETSTLRDGPAYKNTDADYGMLTRRVRVQVGQDSNTLVVGLRDESPDRAAQALTVLLNEYQARRHGLMVEEADSTISFLDKEIQAAQARVADQDEALRAFCAKNHILPIKILFENGGDNYLTEQKQDLDKALVDCQVQLVPAEKLRDQVLQADGSHGGAATDQLNIAALLQIGAISHDPTVDEMRKELWAAQASEAVLQGEYLPKYPPLANAIADVTIKQNQLRDAVISARDEILSNAEHWNALQLSLEGRIDDQQVDLKQTGESMVRMTEMMRELQVRQDMVERLMTAKADAQVNREKTDLQVSQINPPESSSKPVNIKWPVFGAALMLLSLACGIAASVLVDTLDDRVRGVEALRGLINLPVLGEIPKVHFLPRLNRIGFDALSSGFTEAIKVVRMSIRAVGQKQSKGMCITVSSALPGEGKSTMSLHLAYSLSLTGARVLLVDGDMRKPSLDRQLDEYHDRGLSLLLAGEQGIEPHETAYANLSLLTAGVIPPNPGELLHSPLLGQQIALWRSTYDYVVIDTPPVLLFADSQLLSEHADGLVLVVRDRVTSKKAIHRTLAMLDLIHTRIAGVVLNGITLGDERENVMKAYRDASLATA